MRIRVVGRLRRAWWELESQTRWRRSITSRLRAIGRLQNPKVFCVGRNKTGTTSLAAALTSLGYRVGRQRDAEFLMEDWGRRDFRRLIKYCHSADAFQDVPFSHDYTFQAMDAAFPGSKFILSIRDSPEQWYQSTIRFQAKRLRERTGENRVPTPDDLKNDPYVYKGWCWRNKELVYGPEEKTLFDEKLYKSHYSRHNERVQDYFRHRPGDLLVINLADPDSMKTLCEFLGHSWRGQEMPLRNASA